METKSIRVLLVDASSSEQGQLRSLLEQVRDVEIVGITHSQRAAFNQIETL